MASKSADKAATAGPLSADELHALDAYWRASNYLSVGQIYLMDNPLLREPLKREHIKPRLLGHWGTSPGLNMLCVHLNRIIKRRDDLEMIYVIGPGHGGPSLVAHAYLEGTYSEVYPNVSQDAAGIKKLFKQFSFPGGIPSHVAPETPGSIHEGGELGYALSHAYGAAFDNRNLIVACIVGDGEAETGPLATGWHGNKFLNPARDGCVLPILHLNGYKIANPCFLARIPKEELQKYFEGMGYKPHFVEGRDPADVHQQLAGVLDTVVAEIKQIWREALLKGTPTRPQWPMIVFRTPKGWTCPAYIDGKKCEDYWRSHQVPMGDMDSLEHIKILEQWLKSYRPEELFDAEGRLKPELAELAPKGHRRMSDNPHTNGGILLRDLKMPDFRDYAVKVPSPGVTTAESARTMGKFLRDVMKENLGSKNFRLFSPDENNSNRWQDVLEVTNRCYMAEIYPEDDKLSPDGRVMEVLSEHQCQGWLEAYLLTGRPGVLQLLRGLHPHHRFDVQSACQVAQSLQPDSLAAADCLVELLPQFARLAAGPQRLQPPGSRLPRPCRQQEGGGHPHLPAARRQHAPVDYRPLFAQPQLRERRRCRQAARLPQWLTMDEAVKHCTEGLGIWEWASNDKGSEPDVVMGCLRRRADPGNSGRGRYDSQAPAGTQGPRRQRGKPDEIAAGKRAPARAF